MTQFDLSNVYNENDLADLCIFSGGFINFGYWADINLEKEILTANERRQSSAELYHQLFKQTIFLPGDKVLEVGCGQGHGALIALDTADNLQLTALDLMALQLKKAHQTLSKSHPVGGSKISFVQGNAERLPFLDNYFDKIYSVESAQHFQSIENFLAEVWRTLAPNGQLLLTTFFSCQDNDMTYLHPKFPYLAQGLDHFIPVQSFIQELNDLGFTNISTVSIGDAVWKGFNRWICQTVKDMHHHSAWSHNWITAYEEGIIDYYMVTARKR